MLAVISIYLNSEELIEHFQKIMSRAIKHRHTFDSLMM